MKKFTIIKLVIGLGMMSILMSVNGQDTFNPYVNEITYRELSAQEPSCGYDCNETIPEYIVAIGLSDEQSWTGNPIIWRVCFDGVIPAGDITLGAGIGTLNVTPQASTDSPGCIDLIQSGPIVPVAGSGALREVIVPVEVSAGMAMDPCSNDANILIEPITWNITVIIPSDMTEETGGGEDNFEQIFTQTFCRNQILPVELVSFDAHRKDFSAVLEWATASELSSSHFVIQRSTDGFDFEEIGQVDAQGNSTKFTSYNFVDQHVVSGSNFYRLKQVDVDGSIWFSGIRRLDFEGEAGVVVYPNPARTSLQYEINLPSESADARMSVIDGLGRQIREVILDGSIYTNSTFDVTDLAVGIYTMRVVSDNYFKTTSFEVIR